MMCCDLSAEVTDCLQTDVEGKEFDLCERCPLVEKLSGTGPVKETLKVMEAEEIEDYEETLI